MKNLFLALKIPYLILSTTLQIFSNRKLLLLYIAPTAIGIVIFVLVFVTSLFFNNEILNLLSIPESAWIRGSAGVILFLFSIFFSGAVSFILTTILASFYVEKIVAFFIKEQNITLPENASLRHTIIVVFKTLLAESIFMLSTLILTITAFALAFFPALSILPITLAIFLAGFNFCNLPLSLLELSYKKRIILVSKLFLPTFVLGGCFTLIMIIPFASIALFPTFYATAVKLLAIDLREFKSLSEHQ